jgi:Caspase recruitment domain
VDLIDTKSSLLLDELVACDCISWHQRQYTEAAESQAEINGRLLDILLRGSEKDCNKFIDSLEKTGQEHLVTPLVKGGVLAHEEAKTNSSSSEETCVVDRIMALFSQSSRAERIMFTPK